MGNAVETPVRKLRRARDRVEAFMDRHGIRVLENGAYTRTFSRLVEVAEANLLSREPPVLDRSQALALFELVQIDADPARDREVLLTLSWLYAQVGLFGMPSGDIG